MVAVPAGRAKAGIYLCLPLMIASLAACGRSDRPDCAVAEAQAAALPTQEGVSPEQAEALWQAGPHARSHLIRGVDNDASCARCHAPESWVPEALPSSWADQGIALASLEQSPSSEWLPIGCEVCHPTEIKEQIDGTIAWLEVPPASQYIPLGAPSDLCLHCHRAGEVEGHVSIEVTGSHMEMECVDCHDPHDASASCSDSGCHEPFAQECEPIETHDKPHMEASCAACHDADGLQIGWNEHDQVWDTIIPASNEAGYRPYASHALVLEVACERCHEPGNHPWGDSKE